MRSALVPALAALALLAMASPAEAETHPFSIHDMLAMERISDPQVSPDYLRVVFTLRSTDLEANRGRTDLWLVPVAGGEPRRLTSHEAGDFNPRWSPDGRFVWFLSTRSGSSQVWKIPVDGGEAVQVTDLPLDAGNLVLSPDGTHLAFTVEVFTDCEGDVPACTRKRLDEREANPRTGLVFEQLFIRHWDTWKDGRRSHLFVMPTGGGPPVDVMPGMEADVPSRPFGGPEEITFTPDGRGLVFAARDAGREEAWSVDFDLYHAPVDASSPPRNLTESNEAWDTQPVFSPDGKTLAWLAMARPGYEADRLRIKLRGWPSGPERSLTEDWDHSARSIVWSSGNDRIYTHADSLGQRALFSIDLRGGKVLTLVSEGTVRSPALAGEHLVFGMDSLASPVELYRVRGDGTGLRSLTTMNHARLRQARLGEAEQFSFAGWNGETVHGYVVKPVDFDPAKKYPVAFLIHGGPQGSFGNDFHYRWNPQAYAGAGYAAVMVDFHGSTGYGQAFTDSIRGDWGGKPLEDLKKGLAAALERYPWMDGGRVAALGASYGGWMINWIAGNWPEGFRCLVSHDGNLDERAAYFMTEELWFPEWDHEGTPWSNPEGYRKHNPVDFVQNWKTPILVIHGALDYRVVDTSGIAAFTAAQRLGVPSKLLYFPDENHWVLKPQNSIQWHETVLDWLDRWTGPGAGE